MRPVSCSPTRASSSASRSRSSSPGWASSGGSPTIVWFLLVLLAGLAALIGRRFIKKIEKPERTLETLHDLPDVLHREAPGERHREVPVVTNGRVALRGNESYKV